MLSSSTYRRSSTIFYSGHDPPTVCNVQPIEGHPGCTPRAVHCAVCRVLHRHCHVQFSNIRHRYGSREAVDPRHL